MARDRLEGIKLCLCACALKLGDFKSCASDCDAALAEGAADGAAEGVALTRLAVAAA